MENDIDMMGYAVTPVRGQDQGRLFLAVGLTEDGTVLISDGRRRRLSNPKKKKRKHLCVCSPTKLTDTSHTPETDGAVRRILKAYMESSMQRDRFSERRDSSAEG